jgi:hypothetical protein
MAKEETKAEERAAVKAEERAEARAEAKAEAKEKTPYDQLVADLNFIVDDPAVTDAAEMLRRMIERVRRK